MLASGLKANCKVYLSPIEGVIDEHTFIYIDYTGKRPHLSNIT